MTNQIKGRARWSGLLGLVLLIAAEPRVAAGAESAGRWVASWTSAQQEVEPPNLPPAPGFADVTLRQTIRVSLGGEKLRIRISNAFGAEDLRIGLVHVARAVRPGGSAIVPGTDHVVTFGGSPGPVVPKGALLVSDSVPMSIDEQTDLAVSIYLASVSEPITGHPGSRTTSFIQPGNVVGAEALPDATTVDHWYFVSGVEVWRSDFEGAIAILGDSITDGRGSTTNGNDRWPDQLLRRLHDNPSTAGVAVLNQGIGGNRILRDGLGPNVLARLDRDVFAQPGVKWVIVFEGINDLGTANKTRTTGAPFASAADVIHAYEQIILRSHALGLRVFGATITPCGTSFYDTPELEIDRQTINAWIRDSGEFDAVIDFDAAVRDPEAPSRLAEAFDTGDHLHLNPAGYREMAEAVDLSLFHD